ncbi:auxin response factor 3-like isoform X2 [Olea europaea var. sylvestris]|uniref:Auxin response factor n=2 Tax=Olea europaea subsp. europaea TaxID=158383 RepID=A0A8S0UBP4_OLEEU|nr:auxin response factor 3-like isoform X2 [Olea europaea var. sylvestris]CAA3013047.1 auxin response factor 3-like isoform X1 [Olea europaea subsp. europaea]
MVFGLIDLNTVNTDDETSSFDSPSSSSGNLELPASAVCMELWHACAGPLISLPRKGSAVVYFPQGHLERISDHTALASDLPPHVFCRVVDVKLHAEEANDEVYAQVSLVPDNEIEQKWKEGEIEAEGEEEDTVGAEKSITPHMFCKTLTASDTSSHGGFSVPRRAAEDCFPSLDYEQQRPSQELVAKDLHGTLWKFRHIYRGQPRRHLLTTGWSAFVNKKKLVSGDAVLFLRVADGELRLGIRRAAQVKIGTAFPAPYCQQFTSSSMASVAHAISTRRVFNICYNPRASSSEIIVPYHKFLKSLAHSFSAGMRFKMHFEAEDATERRCSGLVIGVSDLDPVRWPGSKWRCLVVRWDDMEGNRHTRVSPWEIEPSGSASGPSSFLVPGTKRTRGSLPTTKPDFPIPRDGNEPSDFGEPSRFQVLQGQEIFCFSTPHGGQSQSQCLSKMRCFPGFRTSMISGVASNIRHLQEDSGTPSAGTGFVESSRFCKVLQGQETSSSLPYGRGPAANQFQENSGSVRLPNYGSHWSAQGQGYTQMRHSAQLVQESSPSSVLLFQQPNSPPCNLQALHLHQKKRETSSRDSVDFERYAREPFQSGSALEDVLRNGSSGQSEEYNQIESSYPRGSQNLVSMCKKGCMLFGFSLIDGKHGASKEDNLTESTTSYNHGTKFLACNEEQVHPSPPVPIKVMSSSCTKARDMHAVRDVLLT